MFSSDTLFRNPQRFLFCLRSDVLSMRSLWVSLVFILFIVVFVFRVAHRATQKTDAVFLSKAHPYSRFIQQPKFRIPSSPYRSNHLSFPSAEVQILPFYIPFPTLDLLQQSAFTELSSISKHFIRPHIVSKYR